MSTFPTRLPSEQAPNHRRRRPPYLRNTLIALLVLTVIIFAGITAGRLLHRPAHSLKGSLEGYVSNPSALTTEYARFKGKSPQDAGMAADFASAAALAQKGDFDGALSLLDTLSKHAAVPVVFNDMGVLYAAIDDRARAINSFREALARDIDYAPVRANLDRLRAEPSSALPVSAEVEPNNTDQLANYIGLNKPVDGEVTPLENDEDCFRVVTPPAPRDLIQINLTDRSQTLEPRVRLYDEVGMILPWEKTNQQPGASLSLVIAPQPNVPLYVHVSGEGTNGGAYTLLVKPLKAFDKYEPNDDIFSATKITLGQKIEANLMDADDTDFYSFAADKTGSVAIDIQNESPTLVPAVTTFAPDMRTTGFGPDVHPGESLHHTMAVQEGQTYFIQVWSQAKTFGEYGLVLTAHPF